MNEEVKQEKRRFVVITDPHIKKDLNFNVFFEGTIEEYGQTYHTEYYRKLNYKHTNFTSIFVKDAKG